MPDRMASCGSSAATASGRTLVEDGESSMSISVNRWGNSTCSDRSRPHTGACTRSRTSSTPAATAPRVSTTRRECANQSSFTHVRSTPPTLRNASCAAVVSLPPVSMSSGQHSTATSGAGSPSTTDTCSEAESACVATCTPADARDTVSPKTSWPTTAQRFASSSEVVRTDGIGAQSMRSNDSCCPPLAALRRAGRSSSTCRVILPEVVRGMWSISYSSSGTLKFDSCSRQAS